ncbi:MAG: hypothetical protein LBH98_06440 [Chitinispirillales bacterium]|jgi:hypothetical protein|nr:hypothetical protein [Chitinispirillales bacterium]
MKKRRSKTVAVIIIIYLLLSACGSEDYKGQENFNAGEVIKKAFIDLLDSGKISIFVPWEITKSGNVSGFRTDVYETFVTGFKREEPKELIEEYKQQTGNIEASLETSNVTILEKYSNLGYYEMTGSIVMIEIDRGQNMQDALIYKFDVMAGKFTVKAVLFIELDSEIFEGFATVDGECVFKELTELIGNKHGN